MHVDDLVRIDAPPGMHDVEVRMAARTPQHGLTGSEQLVQRGAGQRFAAAAAPVAVGEQVRGVGRQI